MKYFPSNVDIARAATAGNSLLCTFKELHPVFYHPEDCPDPFTAREVKDVDSGRPRQNFSQNKPDGSAAVSLL